jgi:hypothetical protein
MHPLDHPTVGDPAAESDRGSAPSASKRDTAVEAGRAIPGSS